MIKSGQVHYLFTSSCYTATVCESVCMWGVSHSHARYGNGTPFPTHSHEAYIRGYTAERNDRVTERPSDTIIIRIAQLHLCFYPALFSSFSFFLIIRKCTQSKLSQVFFLNGSPIYIG